MRTTHAPAFCQGAIFLQHRGKVLAKKSSSLSEFKRKGSKWPKNGIFRAWCWKQGAVLRVHTRYLPGDYLRVIGGVWAIQGMVRLGENHQKSPAVKITEWKYQR